MQLTVAGNQKEYADGLTVAKLIELEEVETPAYVTVSVNDAFIAGGTFEEAVLQDGDRIEFLYFMGGGSA
ncbi:MAG: sulfur carrier protein ThiS [Oscillospiraceae bacterium]|jgi:sulfur carrier protein|nr:sulfur carrier protein ThiS [Oscillospiraceae bacterium]